MFGMKMAMCVCVLGFFAMTAVDACPTDWVNGTCQSNNNCLKANAECFDGECKCSPGFFYSQITKECLASCDDEKLGAPFQVYKASAIYHNDLQHTLEGLCLDECLAACRDNPKCISVDYNPSNTYCHQKPVTKLTAVANSWRNDKDYNHYQKSCM